jgi:hypothetical protein
VKVDWSFSSFAVYITRIQPGHSCKSFCKPYWEKEKKKRKERKDCERRNLIFVVVESRMWRLCDAIAIAIADNGVLRHMTLHFVNYRVTFCSESRRTIIGASRHFSRKVQSVFLPWRLFRIRFIFDRWPHVIRDWRTSKHSNFLSKVEFWAITILHAFCLVIRLRLWRAACCARQRRIRVSDNQDCSFTTST